MATYQILEEIGRGGFGVVERVANHEGKFFARKKFQPSGLVSPADLDRLRQRFQREVKIQRRLGGNEIIPVVDFDLQSDEPWFVMPLAEKTYLQKIEDDRSAGRVDIDALAEILNSLESLHDLAFVHRDLNPRNVLLDDSHWKLSDLGTILPPSGQTVTLTNDTLIYTERYCAPEQRTNFHAATSAADIYSFGCILHDIFNTQQRTPYSQHSADGPIGIIIEKCTELNPARRPSVGRLRTMLLDVLVEMGGECIVADVASSEWLERLELVDDWSDNDFNDFARFFVQLDTKERTGGHGAEWLYSLSTPFLTRVPARALANIAKRNDGVAGAVVEKYCDWARSTDFLFHFADTVCTRLTAIFDNGSPSAKAISMVALLELGESHNRWFVMRQLLSRCSAEQLTQELAQRFEIEILTDELEQRFARCVSEVNWGIGLLPSALADLCR